MFIKAFVKKTEEDLETQVYIIVLGCIWPVNALDITYKFNLIEVFEVSIGYLFFSCNISSS